MKLNLIFTIALSYVETFTENLLKTEIYIHCCQTAKIKHLSIGFGVLFKGKQSMDWGNTVFHKQCSALPEGCLDRSEFYRL